ncbi:hypothetical protein EPA93_11610 [Ktedonosporobacter rubrisoli]|uniref:Uncharacterized protein n=1 Tax=Ktedonosporobacter rubrisoli TaxID=2509675 RepID=A0A4P6JMY4_KTERU|nr:hypothetical protein [Ktedonosporobacter rubrisoli]QBD76614.1 hypothetical protein EPA93_11610 [Ktedonosporobacter rubrisoli]
MSMLLLKLIAAPLLIGIASVAGRRWGPAVSGWLVGLPFTSGPVIFFLALDHGRAFGTAAAIGTLTGTISQAAFSLTYAWLAFTGRWPLALGGSCLAFLLATFALQYFTLPVLPLYLLILVVIVATLLLLPRTSSALVARAPARWDIPLRMLIATVFVLALTTLAPLLGPQLSGLLTPFPLYATILSVFAHSTQGPGASANVLRGLQFGLFAFITFFLVLALLIQQGSLGLAFLIATACALIVQACMLVVFRRLTRAQAVKPALLNEPHDQQSGSHTHPLTR